MNNFRTIQYSPKKLQIKSKLYQKKYQDGLPKVKQKQIPTHFTYNITQKNIKLDNSINPQFWARTTSIQAKSNNTSKQKDPLRTTMYDILLNKYVIRKSKKLSKWGALSKIKLKQNHSSKKLEIRTLTSFRKKSNTQFRNTFIYQNQGIIQDLYHKNLHQMSIRQLQTSMKWKRQFLRYLQCKMQQKKMANIEKKETITLKDYKVQN